MTVRFTAGAAASPRPAAGPTPAVVLSPLLRDRHRLAQPADQRLLALYTRGISAGLPVSAITQFVKARDVSLRDALDGSPGLARVAAAEARRWAKSAASPGHAERLRREVARRGLARLLSPTPERVEVSARLDVTCRMVFALMVARSIEIATTEGKSGLIFTAGYAGAQLNLSLRQVQNCLTRLERDYGWIRRAGSAGGGRILWRLTKLGEQELRDTAWAHADAVDALAAGRPELHGLAATLMTAGHPAWHYSVGELGARAYLRLLGQYAEPGTWVGLAAKAMSAAKKALDRCGLRDTDPAELRTRLDAIAEDTLANFIAEDRRRDMHAAAVEQRQKLEAFRAERDARYELQKAARAVLRGVVKTVGAVPVGDRQAFELWVSQMAAVALPALTTGVEAEAYSHELAAALGRSGWDADVQTKVAAFVGQQARARSAA